jgi:putative transposase
VVTPAGRKDLVGYIQTAYTLSQRRICRLIPISRKALRYTPIPRTGDAVLQERLQSLGERHPRYGYLMLHEMLKAEGIVQNRKRTYRVYRELNMQVRTKKRKKLIRPRIPMAIPSRPNERWSLDFVSDQLADGRRFRVLNIVDDYSRVCVGQIVDLSISGLRLTRYLEQLRETRGLPQGLVLDNGPELTCKAMFFWAQQAGVKLLFIQPGKPTQNAFVESFNGRFRDGCLNQHWFRDLDDARQIIGAWRNHYNHERPHSSLGYKIPMVFEKEAA